jgi:thymidylate kinase
MGADGAGKTTLARELAKRFADWGYACRHMHWRPSVLPSLSSLVGRDPEVPEAARTPHLAEPKSRLLSALQFVYYMLDFELGYALRILPYRVKKSVVVVERYCYDFVVDSRRYNMVLPRFLARLGARIAPKPDLVLLVDGDEATLWNRKRELDPEELRRQIGLYRRFVRCCRNGHSIRSVGRSVEIVASDAMALICDVFRRRFAARRHGPLGGETGNSFRVLLGLPEQVVWADTSSGSFLRQLGLGDLLEGFEAALGGLEFAESGSAVVFPREPGRSFLSNDGYRVTARAWLNLAGRSSQDGCSLLRPIRVRGRVFWINPAFHSRLALWSPYTPFARLWNGLMRSELLGDCLLRGVCVAIKGATGSFLHRVLADACSPDFRVVASYAGTSAPASDRKVMLQIADKKGETLAYVKVAGRNRARRKLENEARVLRYLAQEGAVADRIPRLIRLVKGRRTTLLVSTPVPCPLRTVSSWSAVQENFLLHLHQRTRAIGRLTDMPLWNDMCRRLQIGRISHHHWADVLELSKDFIESRLGAIVRTYVLAHRDFAPWNMGMLPGGELFVLDWEDASSGGTPLHDYLHFILWPLALRSRSTIELSGIVSSSSFRRNLALRARSLGWPDLIPEAIGLYLLDVALDRLEACHESRLHPLGDALAAAYLVALERHLLACR